MREFCIAIAASAFVALCARVTMPLPFTPVPLTLQNFGVLLVALLLGPRRAGVAMLAYLAEGAAGLPVFNPTGVGGIAQLFGPTGGFLMAYPVVALMAGFFVSARRTTASHRSYFAQALLGCTLAELVLFTLGAAWLVLLTHATLSIALSSAVLPFLPGDVLKIAAAAGCAAGIARFRASRAVRQS